MNQILVVGNKSGKKTNSTVDIKKVILVFSIGIIIFGGILLFEGIHGLTKNNKQPQNDGIVPPIETATPSVPNYDDDEAPTIELKIVGETVQIIAKDETEIDYIEYGWENDEVNKVNSSVDEKNKIEASITIKRGVNTLIVKAVDKAGNEFEERRDFKGQIRPTVIVTKNLEETAAIIEATCDDGLAKIEFTLNGEWTKIPFDEYPNTTKEEWAESGVTIEMDSEGKIVKASYTQPFVEGENKLSVYAYSKEGPVGTFDGHATYEPGT